MLDLIEHSADLIKAASVNILGVGALILLLIAGLTFYFIRKSKLKIRILAITAFSCLSLIVLLILNYRSSDNAAHSNAKNSQIDIETKGTTQTGEVNVNGVGGNVNLKAKDSFGSGRPKNDSR